MSRRRRCLFAAVHAAAAAVLLWPAFPMAAHFDANGVAKLVSIAGAGSLLSQLALGRFAARPRSRLLLALAATAACYLPAVVAWGFVLRGLSLGDPPTLHELGRLVPFAAVVGGLFTAGYWLPFAFASYAIATGPGWTRRPAAKMAAALLLLAFAATAARWATRFPSESALEARLAELRSPESAGRRYALARELLDVIVASEPGDETGRAYRAACGLGRAYLDTRDAEILRAVDEYTDPPYGDHQVLCEVYVAAWPDRGVRERYPPDAGPVRRCWERETADTSAMMREIWLARLEDGCLHH